MLSYLQEGHAQEPDGDTTSDGQPVADQAGDQPVSQQSDYLTVSGYGQKLRQSTLLLIAVFGIGALGVWFMVKKTTPVQALAADNDQSQLDAAIAQLNGMQSEMNTQMDSAVGRFYQSSSVGQIGVDELKKNPFKREAGSGVSVVSELDLQQRRLEGQIRQIAAGLQLWSITATPRGVCCMINDKVLYVGDTIEGLAVAQIGEKEVKLELDGVSIQLKMDE